MPEFIDKSRYYSPGDEYIVEVRYENDGDLEGYVITTTLQIMEFKIDNYQFSTESWGVDLSLAQEQLIDRKVKKVGWLGRDVKDDVGYVRSASIEMILEGDGEDDIAVDIDVYNCHNGAYPHSYYVKWGSYEDEEFIDKSRYYSPGDEYIVEVRYENDGDFEGYVITTSLQTMEFLISSYRNCCEGWGVAMSLNEDQLLNRKVKYVGWLGRGVRDLIEPHDDEYCYHALIEMILEGNENEGDDIVVEIDIYNCHNGYYHHMYLVKWGLYKDKDQL